jgi:hypothetical protein
MESITRNEAIAAIRSSLKRRSNRPWSVTGGRGTAWGWLLIDAPPKRKTWSVRPKGTVPETYEEFDTGEKGGHTGPEDRAELDRLLAITNSGRDGVSVAASSDYYREYLQRAEGKQPTAIAQPYWD